MYWHVHGNIYIKKYLFYEFSRRNAIDAHKHFTFVPRWWFNGDGVGHSFFNALKKSFNFYCKYKYTVQIKWTHYVIADIVIRYLKILDKNIMMLGHTVEKLFSPWAYMNKSFSVINWNIISTSVSSLSLKVFWV